MNKKRLLPDLVSIFLIIAVLAVFGLTGCPSVTSSCSRSSDGTITCTIDAHKDGNHDKPIK